MHNRVTMEVAKRKNNLCCDKLYGRLVEPLHFVQVVVYVATWYIFEEEVNAQVVLEHILHLVDEWVISLKQNLLLNLNILNLILLQNDILIQPLHRIYFTIL